ncbi:hypothetical protein V6N13_102704 [Hibiscus sabdariffa]|uniref:Uncharacterized protein n=2 Tax=Hibiscus sabdariffa TaxID=183260 RepID=A0ABR2D7P2_9ROSI
MSKPSSPGKRNKSGGSSEGGIDPIDVITLDPAHPPVTERHSVLQGNGKHSAWKIVDKGGSRKGIIKGRPGSVGFKVGKIGKDNISIGVLNRYNLESSASGKVVAPNWINSILGQLDEIAAQTGGMEVLGVRSMEEDDPGDGQRTENEYDVGMNDGSGSGIVAKSSMML